MSCKISKDLVGELVTSPVLMRRLKNDIENISVLKKKIESLAGGKNVTKIAELENSIKSIESNIIYMGFSKHIKDILNDGIFKAKEDIDVFKDILKQRLPKQYKGYIDLISQRNVYNNLVKGDFTELAYTIAFDVSMYHKFNDFKAIEKGSKEYLAKNALGASDSGYSIYRNIIKSIVDNEDVDVAKVVKELKDTKNGGIIIKSEDDLYKQLNNSKTFKELEDVFLAGLNHVSKKNLEFFIKKVKDLKFIGNNKDSIEAIIKEIDSPFFNSRKINTYKQFSSMNGRALVMYKQFDEEGLLYIKREPSEFIQKVTDLLLGSRKEITIGKKTYGEADKDMLARVIGEDILESSFAREGANTFKYNELRTLAESNNIVKIEKNKPKTKFDTPLHKEARKYKSAEEFAEAQRKKSQEYKDGHVAPSSEDSPIKSRMEDGGDFNLGEIAKGYHNQPADYFDVNVGPRYYSYNTPIGKQSLKAIRDVIDGKTDTLTAYRVIPKNIKQEKLLDGDWITFSKDYAKQHGLHRFDGEYKIIEQRVNKKDVWWDGNDINEWGFDTGKSRKKSKQIREEANLEKQIDEVFDDKINDYGESIFRVVTRDGNAGDVGDNVFYNFSSSTEYKVGFDPYKLVREANSIGLGRPGEVISDRGLLEEKISSLKKGETLNVILEDANIADELKNIPVPKGATVKVNYPRDLNSKFYIDDGVLKIGFNNLGTKTTILSHFRKMGINIGVDGSFDIPENILPLMAKGFDENMTIKMLSEMYGIGDITDVGEYTQLIKGAGMIDGRFASVFVDYGSERNKIKDLPDEFFRNKAIELSDGGKVADEIADINDVKKAYFDYNYAKTLEDKQIALSIFLELYKTKPGDLFLNFRKQMELFGNLRKEININYEGFDELVVLLEKNDVPDSVLENNKFLRNTVIKNRELEIGFAKNERTLYEYIKTLKSGVDNKVGQSIDVNQKSLRDRVSLDIGGGKGYALVDNNIDTIPISTDVYNKLQYSDTYQISDDLKMVINKQRKMREGLLVGEEIVDDTMSHADVVGMFKGDLRSLFASYTDSVNKLIEKGGDDVNLKLRKLHQSFKKTMLDLESNMEYCFGKATDPGEKLTGFHHKIGEFNTNDNFELYIKNLDQQRNIIERRLDVVMGNISEGYNNGGLMKNNNIVRGQFIEDGANYAYNMALKNGEDVPMSAIKSMNHKQLREYIQSQVNKFNEDVANFGIIKKVYEALPGLKGSRILDDGVLVDSYAFGIKIPKWMVNDNPSIYAKSKAIPMEYNQPLLVDIFKAISETYTTKGYMFDGKPLRMGFNAESNREVIKKIVSDKVETTISDIVTKEGESFAEGMSKKNIIPEYLKAFDDYSELIKLPKELIEHITDKFGNKGVNIDDFFKRYIGEQEVIMKGDASGLSDEYIAKVDKAIDDAYKLIENGFKESYEDVIHGGFFTNFFARQIRDVFSNDSQGGRWIVKLVDLLKSEGKNAGNLLYRIVPENMLGGVDFLKAKESGKIADAIYQFDYKLLYKAQDSLKEIRRLGLSGERLDIWLGKNSETHNQIAAGMAKYFDVYKRTIGNSINKDYVSALDQLDDVFTRIGRNENGEILDTPNLSEMKKEVYALASIAENNAPLGVFNLRYAPKTPLSKISFKIFEDGKLVVKDGKASIEGYEKYFNELFGTKITADQYRQVYKGLFGGRLVRFPMWIEKTQSFLNKYAGGVLKSKFIRMPKVVGLTILTGISTGLVPGLTRGRRMTEFISKEDRSILYELIGEYSLLDEYTGFTAGGLEQILKEAEKLGGGNIPKGIMKSLQFGSLKNSYDLVTNNFNNFLDLVLMGNYRLYAVDSALKSLEGRKFNSAESFKEYLKGLDDGSKKKVIDELKVLSNRSFYSIIAAEDTSASKQLNKLSGTKVGAILSGVRQNISFLNGWGDGIVKHYFRAIMNSADIGAYFVKNGFNGKTISNVEEFIRRTPEFQQFVSTITSDILLFARGLRQWETGDDLYENGEGLTFGDIVDAINVMTTVGNGMASSIIGQTLVRATEMANRETKKNQEGVNNYSYMRTRGVAMAQTLFQRMFSDLKYLGPWNKLALDISDGVDPFTAVSNMVAEAGGGMARFLMEESYDPDNISYSFQERQRVPDVMGTDLSDDMKDAYDVRFSKLVSESSMSFWNTLCGMLQTTLINSKILRPLDKLKSDFKYMSKNEIEKAAAEREDLVGFFKKETPKVEIQDANDIRTLVFNTNLIKQTTMGDWLDNGIVKQGNPSLDDGIAIIYEYLGENRVRKYYDMLGGSLESDMGIKMTKKEVENYILKDIQKELDSADLGPVGDMARSTLVQNQLAFMVKNEADNLDRSIEKDRLYVERFKQYYPWMLENNLGQMLEFVMKRHNRITDETPFDFYDDYGNINEMYYDSFRDIFLTKQAIDDGDVDYIDGMFNPLSKSLRFDVYKLIKKDNTIDDVSLDVINRTVNYVKNNQDKRERGVTASILSSVVGYNLDGFVEAYRKNVELVGGVTEGMETFIDNIFYTESLLTDIIADLQTGLDVSKGGDGDSSKLPKLKSDFEKIAKAIDPIREEYKSAVRLDEFKQLPFIPYSQERKNIKPSQIKSFAPQKTKSIYENSVNEKKIKDINRRIKNPKEFKYKS